ncbi:MAG: hypothetical protein GYB67_12985 [Chloroflexi bacterium]|nr:hypothetical protein [Chloroflexota bacterium]
MQFTREINRILFGILIAFAVVTISAAYWAIIGPDTLLNRNDNPRLVDANAALLRGAIYDRATRPLVETIPQGGAPIIRRYLEPSMYSALGHFSHRYGVSGVEAAFDAVLRGADLTPDFLTTLTASLLHQPQRGSDLRVTFDLTVQETIADALNDHSGAVIVMSVPSGQILALVSAPAYDPNRLDADWDTFTKAPDDPLFIRALQGQYQHGGALQTALLAAALLVDESIETPYPNATAPIALENGVTLNCAVPLPAMPLNLRDAYAFACPAPFAALVDTLGVATVQAVFDTFLIDPPPLLPDPTLDETPIPESITLTPTPLVNSANLRDNALGQGQFTTTPLGMAMMAAAIVNDGNAPHPYVLHATRAPGISAWTTTTNTRTSFPVMTITTARRLQDIMRNAVVNGAAQNAARPGIDIGGHAALAYSGEETLAWFVGFATSGADESVAIAVVLEDTADLGLAADIGGRALDAAKAVIRAEAAVSALTRPATAAPAAPAF